MNRPGFKNKLESENGHIYLKVLKENIIDELKFNDDEKGDSLFFDRSEYNEETKLLMYEPYSRYNMSHALNENAVGYEDIEKRL